MGIAKNEDSVVMKERLEFVKNSLLERVNETAQLKKQRRASVSSLDGRKRNASGEIGDERSALRRQSSLTPPV